MSNDLALISIFITMAKRGHSPHFDETIGKRTYKGGKEEKPGRKD